LEPRQAREGREMNIPEMLRKGRREEALSWCVRQVRQVIKTLKDNADEADPTTMTLLLGNVVNRLFEEMNYDGDLN
jgi:hypothetical protein